MNKAYILTGGNMGNSHQYLHRAALAIAAECGDIVQQSSLYQTAAWGNEAQPDFLNQVLCISTSMQPFKLLRLLLGIEKKLGRTRGLPNDPRTIDIDLLMFESLVLKTETLQLPHPRLHLRRFVLVPLCEIAPLLEHPALKKNMQQLLDECTDTLNVKKFSL